jgi:predicted dehydrogenase
VPLEEHQGEVAMSRGAGAGAGGNAGRTVRWGILGPGYIAGIFADDLAATEGAELVAVASRDERRAAAFAARHGVGRSYGDYRRLGEDRDVDVVYVATPHSHHFEHTKLMLELGKAVLVEKPFTMTAAQAQELCDIARSRDAFLMEAVWTLCNPLVRDLARRVQDGAIGTPTAFSASLGPIGGIPKGHRVEDPGQGGSFLLECMMYPLSLVATLAPDLARADDVFASAVKTDRGVDVAASMTLVSRSGIATMSGGFVTGSEGAGTSTFHLTGTHGWLQVDDNLFNPGHAVISSAAGLTPLGTSAHLQGYRWEIEEVSRCIRRGATESDLVPLSRSVAVMRLLDRGRDVAGVGVQS